MFSNLVCSLVHDAVSLSLSLPLSLSLSLSLCYAKHYSLIPFWGLYNFHSRTFVQLQVSDMIHMLNTGRMQ